MASASGRPFPWVVSDLPLSFLFPPLRREVQDYIPPQYCGLLKAHAWLDMVTQHAQQTQALSAHQARAQFLGKMLR